ncbi:MAG: hypothetical protein HY319_13290 [Armatimonadetes bacterium]|nr:hypothetical protein [Armatimonadota bacterium]
MQIPAQAQNYVDRFLKTGKLSENATRTEVSESDSFMARLESRYEKGAVEQTDNTELDKNKAAGHIEMDLAQTGEHGTFHARVENLDADGDAYRLESVLDRGDGNVDVGVVQNGADTFDSIVVSLNPHGGRVEAAHLPHQGPGYQETVEWEIATCPRRP